MLLEKVRKTLRKRIIGRMVKEKILKFLKDEMKEIEEARERAKELDGDWDFFLSGQWHEVDKLMTRVEKM